ncbi:MAG: DUF3526 domain-containing protein [Pseudomonadota bacterium]
MDDLKREAGLAWRDRTVRWSVLGLLVLSLLALGTGWADVAEQRTTLSELKARVDVERAAAIDGQSDAGGAAYYAFHLTYSPPSALAFAAQGVRDVLPYKHRMRMLALEGQIYETDSQNVELSSIGRLDFAFVVAVILPLFLILVLHDLRASEARAGRFTLLCATSPDGAALFWRRAAVRTLFLITVALVPFVVAALVSGAALPGIAVVIGVLIGHALLWLILSNWLASRIQHGATVLTVLLGLWLLSAVAVPAVGKQVVENAVALPNGGELLLLQRETVNAAWDRTKQETMDPFIKAHPQWADYAEVSRPFEWKWYYAFQWLGDDRAAALSTELREGVSQRHRLMGFVAWLSPTLLTERLMARAADTDIPAYQRYENCVRAFHTSLREFHYPMLFGAIEYSEAAMARLPDYAPCDS